MSKTAPVAVPVPADTGGGDKPSKSTGTTLRKKKGGARNTLVKGPPLALSRDDQTARAIKMAQAIKTKLRINCIVTGRTGPQDGLTYLTTGHQVIDDAISGALDDDQEIIAGTGKGLPRGRIVEIYGKEASCKTSLALSVIAAAQKQGESVAFVDVEHAFNADVASKLLGVHVPSLILAQPDDGEEALQLVEELVIQNVSVIVLDSVAALVTEAEAQGSKGIGEQARLMSKWCRKLTTLLKPGGPIIIFLNQVRNKIGVMYGDPETTSGGQALGFYASVRLRLRKKKEVRKTSKRQKGQPKTVAIDVAAKVVKNKVAPMGGYVEFRFHFKHGIQTGIKSKGDDE